VSDRELYAENGYLHARGVFDAGEVEEMRAAIGRRRPRFEVLPS
jgi:hypothetical protein